MTTILVCKCGDCKHWEIIHRDGEAVLKCVSCNVEYKGDVTVDAHEDLHFAEGVNSLYT